MNKLTAGLLLIGGALAVFARRDAQRAQAAKANVTQQPTPQRMAQTTTMPRPKVKDIDPGIVVHSPFRGDDGMAVRSPFQGDNGMVVNLAPDVQPSTQPQKDKEK